MLVEFRVANHRSIRAEQVLSLEAASPVAADDTVCRRVAGATDALLPVVALYGANASGKSNVLSAFAFMRQAVLLSHRLWDPLGGVPREPFAWADEGQASSLFEVAFILNGCRYEYGFVADDAAFVEEWLYAYPNGLKQVWFERDGQELEFGDALVGDNRVVERVTRPNALFLSAAAQLSHEQLEPVFSWFDKHQLVNVGEGGRPAPSEVLGKWLGAESTQQRNLEFESSEENGRLEQVVALIRAADFGVVGVKVEKSEAPFQQGSGGRRRDRHQVFLGHRTEHGEVWFPIEEESHGTQTWSALAPAVLDALACGSLLLVDELEAGLHPLLAMKLVRLFNERATNPNNAQLVFSTHDTNLIGQAQGESLLRRDQVWLTEKDSTAATTLYPLTDYKPLNGENVERGYLQGRYGAVPCLGDLLRGRT